MKTSNKFFKPALLGLVITLHFFSCYKDEAVHNFNPQEVREQPHDISKDSVLQQYSVEDNIVDFGSNDDTELLASLEKVLKTTQFDVHPEWKLAIKASTCLSRGKTLLVYNPEDSDPGFYNSRRFSVLWFKDGRPYAGNTNQIDCVCTGKYIVVVINKATQSAVGIAFYSNIRRTCFDAENSVADTDE